MLKPSTHNIKSNLTLINKIQKILLGFYQWQKKSLKARLLLSVFVMVVIMLPIIGMTLNNAFDEQLKSAIRNELKAYSYSILTVAEVEGNQLLMPDVLLENQFNVIHSGLYALITKIPSSLSSTQLNKTLNQVSHLWLSESLLTLTLPDNLPMPAVGDMAYSEVIIEEKIHLLYSFSVSFSDNGQVFPVTLHILKDKTEFLTVLNDFKQQLWTWLIILMLLFVFVQITWLLWTLKPLTVLARELESVEQGEKNALEEKYPLELQQVTSQLNTLLLTEQSQRKRYRNALSDLAHSLKNPLAVIQSQAELSTSSVEQLTLINQIIEHQLKKAQSAGESSWYLGVPVKQVADKLISTLAKIYHSKDIHFILDISTSVIFKGDEADLMEILGNILDNACKAAKQKVAISVKNENKTLIITIEDDGSGVNDTQKELILSRGVRADTYKAGYGIGLAIVRDLIASYQGKLCIETSEQLKGAAFIIKFNI